MAISTYAELETAVENWLHRSDLDSRIPEFITLGEARIGREVKARQMEGSTASAAGSTVTLPTDYIAMRGVRSQSASIGWYEYMTPDAFFSTTAASSSSTIKKYTIFGEQLVFPVAPDGLVEIWYYKKLAALSGALNTLFTVNPDLYLYAALAAAAPFQVSNQRLQMMDALYQQARESVNSSHKEGRYPPGMAVRVA